MTTVSASGRRPPSIAALATSASVSAAPVPRRYSIFQVAQPARPGSGTSGRACSMPYCRLPEAAVHDDHHAARGHRRGLRSARRTGRLVAVRDLRRPSRPASGPGHGGSSSPQPASAASPPRASRLRRRTRVTRRRPAAWRSRPSRSSTARRTRRRPRRRAAGAADRGRGYAVAVGQRDQPVGIRRRGTVTSARAGRLGEQRRRTGRRRSVTVAPTPWRSAASTSACASPPSERSWARSARPTAGARAARPAPARRPGRPAGGSPPRWPWTTCAHSEPASSSRVSPSRKTCSPSAREARGRTPGDVVDHAEHRRPPVSAGSRSRRSGCRG